MPTPLTITRASPETAQIGAEVFTVPAGVPAIGDHGLQVYAASTNLCLESQTIATGTAPTSPWAVVGTTSAAPTLDDNAAIAPDGTMTACRIDFNAINATAERSIIYQKPITLTVASQTLSFWARTVSGTGTLYLSIVADVSHGQTLSCNLTTTWQRFSTTFTGTASGWYILVGPFGDWYSPVAVQPNVQPALSCYIWGVQLEASPVATPYIPTTTVPVARSADVVSVPVAVNMVPSAGVAAPWCIGVRLTADWATAVERQMFTAGVPGTANSIEAFIHSGTEMDIRVWDGAGVKKGKWRYQTFAQGSEHTILFENRGGDIQLWFDGVLQSTTLDGAGTGIMAVNPASFQLGGYSASYTLNGSIKQFVQGTSVREVQAELDKGYVDSTVLYWVAGRTGGHWVI